MTSQNYSFQQLEGLAKEKQLLEQRLAHEKEALTNEKQDLSDQLRTAFVQLEETKNFLLKEQLVKQQLEQENEQLENEKKELVVSLQDKTDEMAALKNELLRLQANFEKDRRLIESLQLQSSEQEKQIVILRASIDEEYARKQIFETEKDEFIQ